LGDGAVWSNNSIGVFREKKEKNPNSIGPPVEEKSGLVGPGPGRLKFPTFLLKLAADKPE